MSRKRSRIWWLLLLALAGCNDGGADPHSAGIAGSGAMTAGGSSSAGVSGTGTGGTAANAGNAGAEEELTLGGIPEAELCSPGEYHYMSDILCQRDGHGIMIRNDFTIVETVELPAPMVPGQPYSISIEHKTPMANPAVWIEDVYGVMSTCAEEGETPQLLGTHMLDRGAAAYCLTLMPQQAFTHVLFAAALTASDGWMARGGFQYCPNVTCPAP